MMRGTRGARVLVVLAVFSYAGNAAAADVLGKWVRQDGTAQITIAPCGQKLCAVNTWVRDPEGSEKVGDTLVLSLQEASPSAFKGEAYDQRRNMTYAMTISLAAGDMRTHGCMLMGLLCKSADWIRPR
jgi:uncharacterized protein (DUF2147 family)